MDWENARWVKLYCLETGTWLRLGWQGRTVALHLLRAVNASGVISDLGDEPALVLAELCDFRGCRRTWVVLCCEPKQSPWTKGC